VSGVSAGSLMIACELCQLSSECELCERRVCGRPASPRVPGATCGWTAMNMTGSGGVARCMVRAPLCGTLRSDMTESGRYMTAVLRSVLQDPSYTYCEVPCV
jgi:hypothetical protein